MAAFLDVCRFTPTAGGTTDWTYSVAVTGYQSPALANAVNGRVYKFRAESADLSQWELAEGAYNSSTGAFARTTVLFNSSGTGTAAGQSGAGTKISFSTVPQVAVVALKEDFISVEEANAFTTAQQAQIRTNIGLDKFYFSASLSANQSISNAVFTKLNIDSELTDPSNWYDNATNFRFQPTIAGKYRIRGQMQAQGTTLSEIDIDIRKNGSVYSRTIILASGPASSSLIGEIVAFNGSTDYIELFGLVAGTGTLNVLGGTAPIRTWFEAQYVGP
jgi:hypothetical protein